MIDNLSQKHSNCTEDDYNELRNSCIMSWDTAFLLWHLVFFSKPIEIETGTKHLNPIFGEENQFGGHENVTPRGKITDTL